VPRAAWPSAGAPLEGLVKEQDGDALLGEPAKRVEGAVHAIGIHFGGAREEHADGVDHQQAGAVRAE
jgi:hypothetical protein